MTTTATITPTGLPVWSREAAIGDYGGAIDKEDSETEAFEPYAAQWYRELHAMRGSAYTTAPYTLVDAENIAIARMSSAVWSRTPEKVRANATPRRSDEKLEYWVEVLGIATRDGEQRWQLRDRAVAHDRASQGPTIQNIIDSLSELLGDTFVQVHLQTGVDLDTPPTSTYWPTFNPGPSSLSLGAGAWMSERSHLYVQVTRTGALSTAEFLNLMNVQFFGLLDGLLPAWATFDWSTGDGFLVGISEVGFDGVTT